MKVTLLLKRDHAEVEGLFQQFDKLTDTDRRAESFERIRQELEAHAQVEEELFYPACAKFADLKDLVQEAQQEHRMVRQLCAEISRLDPSDDEYVDKVQTLHDNVRHHVEEEENEIFPAIKKHLSDDRLDDIGAQVEQRKTALQRKGKKVLTPA